MSDYLAVNLANWDSRFPHHVRGYGLDQFRSDLGYLSDVVRLDLPRLGSIDGVRRRPLVPAPLPLERPGS